MSRILYWKLPCRSPSHSQVTRPQPQQTKIPRKSLNCVPSLNYGSCIAENEDRILNPPVSYFHLSIHTRVYFHLSTLSIIAKSAGLLKTVYKTFIILTEYITKKLEYILENFRGEKLIFTYK